MASMMMMIKKQIWLLGLVLATTVVGVVPTDDKELLVDTTSTCQNSYSPHGLDRGILSWIHNTPGGYYNPKQEFRHADPNDPTSLAGIFAKERIEQGELLCRVPWEYIVTGPKKEVIVEQLECSMVDVLSRELQLGKLSKFAPYVEYLKTQPLHQLPSVWSTEAQDLLMQILGQSRQQNADGEPVIDDDLVSLSFPPLRMLTWMEEWQDRCQGNPNDTWGRRAALMAILRADDAIMIPAYDFYNHRNGQWHNADTKGEFGSHHETRARRTIEAGEQIFISYYRCLDCAGRAEGYGTAEVLRDYGFIEPFPQHWYFQHYNTKELTEAESEIAYHVEFDLDQKDGYYTVGWMHQPRGHKVEKSLAWLQSQIMRLTRLRYKESNNTRGIPQHEWDTTWAFHQANVVAMKSAKFALQGQNLSIVGGTTTSIDDLYYDLAANPDHSWRIADAESPACEMHEFDSFTRIDGAFSYLNSIDICEERGNICLDQNNKAYMCSSFRPGYYEYFVHPAMSYLTTSKRVLIIANGASFLLDEILKYDIDYALVLELDQTMTHMSQKYFGVDPHLNDPRIEWWFSDPSEVLPLIENKWGSFDVVMIDVPDSTYQALFRYGGDLGQLVNRHGIVITNKSHMQQFSKSFRFASRLAYDLTPECTRVITWGSHFIDFARAPIVDHNVEALFFQSSMMKENRFLLLQDFTSDDNIPTSIADASTQSVQTTNHTWGMIQILELVHETSQLKGLLEESLTEHGFEVLSTTELASSYLITMKEGYIMARQKRAYIGVDVHLSSHLPKLSPLVNSIVDKFGPALSSYRLVTSGREPAGRHHSKSTKSKPSALHTDDAILGDVLSEITTTMLSSSKSALVICQTIQDCPSHDRLKALGTMETVLAVEVCPDIHLNESEDLLVERMLACEERLQEWIQHALIEKQVSVDAIFLDGGLTFRSLQLVDVMLTADDQAWAAWISKSNILVTLPTRIPTSEARRFVSNHVHNVRRILVQDERNGVAHLVSKADFVVASQDEAHYTELSIVVTRGTRDIRQSFQTLEANLSEKLQRNADLRVRICELQAGPLENIQLVPPRRFQHDDHPSLAKFDSASPSAAHAVIQLAAKKGVPFIMKDVVADVTQALQSIGLVVLQEHVLENMTVLDLLRGEMIITMPNKEGIDLHFYLPCVKGNCPMSVFVEFVRPLRSNHPDWGLLSFDVLPRGPRKTIGFDEYSNLRDDPEEGGDEDEDHNNDHDDADDVHDDEQDVEDE